MKKFLLVLALLAGFAVTAEASVKDVRWGVDDKQVLRFVVDLTDHAAFQVKIENNTLAVTVETPFEGVERCEPVDSRYARSFYVQALGTQTVVRVPFLEPVSMADVKYFTLDADEQKPRRIVVDVAKQSGTDGVAGGTAEVTSEAVQQAEIVQTPAGIRGDAAESTVVVSQPGKMLSPQELIALAAQGKKTVMPAEPVRQSIDVPPIPKREAAESGSSKDVVGNRPLRVTVGNTAPKMQVGMPKADGKKTKEAVKALEEQAGAKTPVTGAKIVTGNRPVNQDAAREDAARRGREAVNNILRNIGIEHQGESAVSVQREQSGAKALPTLPVIADNEPVDTGRTEPMPVLIHEDDPLLAVDSRAGHKVKQTKRSGKYRTGGGVKGKIITVDAGHGGSDPGAVSKKKILEKDVTLAMAKKLKEELEDLGAKVYMTRTRDVEVAGPGADDVEELQARVDKAEAEESDLFISLHINASLNQKATGISTYYFPKSNCDVKLAQSIHKQLTDNFGLKDRGAREANFYVTKKCSMPAVLMELGFLSNDKEAKLVAGNWFQNKAMTLVAKGIRDYFK